MIPTASQKWLALICMRCPRCCDGSIYAHGMTMNERCPVCNMRFEREPGYFMGALYISYALAIVVLLLFMWLGTLILPDVDLGWIVLICAACFVPFVPVVTRYARVIWIHFDRWAWPSRPEDGD
ncbi:MAG: DUF983 domain-containing protein [Planctomycetes bacterium]|nr:DUF983 domain-containing protein [Planctomycetota bacterium]